MLYYFVAPTIYLIFSNYILKHKLLDRYKKDLYNTIIIIYNNKNIRYELQFINLRKSLYFYFEIVLLLKCLLFSQLRGADLTLF